MDYIKGEDRYQYCIMNLDEEVEKKHIVRVIDAFVNKLDLRKYNFTYSDPSKLGRKSYDPKDMLKLYLYGYIDGIRTSRKLEKATIESIPFRWLMHNLKPDFKTISDFRKENIMNIRSVFLEFSRLCIWAKLIDFQLVAIDGSHIEAVNHNQNIYTEEKVLILLKKMKNKFDKFHKEYYPEGSLESLKTDNEELLKLKEEMKFYTELLEKMKKEKITQVSLTDPECKIMQKRNSKKDACFNAQSCVDRKNKLIVEIEVCNDTNDSKQLYNVAKKTKDTYNLTSMKVTADKGYGFGKEIKKCNDDNIETFVPIQNSSSNSKYGPKWDNTNFIYNSETDSYTCPNGCQLTLMYTRESRESKEYGNRKACKMCPYCNECTANNKRKYRTISRSFYAEVIEKQKEINSKNMDIIKQRKSIVEHPFGTIKKTMNQASFVTKGLKSVNGEFTYSALAYNIKRVYNILGFDKMMEVINAYFGSGTPKNRHFYQNFVKNVYFYQNWSKMEFKMAS